MRLRIGILGSRGIPNFYGGFEQFASYLAPGLVERGADVWVYNAHHHPYREDEWKGVRIVRCYDPEVRMGAAGQFFYDLNCIRDTHRLDLDILLQLGYTSSSVWYRTLPEGPEVVTNMDGLEWSRRKYPPPVRRFLKYAEKLAVRSSDVLVADSEAIRDYLHRQYNTRARYIPYGAEIFNRPDAAVVERLGLKPGGYFLVVARLQPDNHIAEIIEGYLRSKTTRPLVIVGNHQNRYGRKLIRKYTDARLHFAGSIFDAVLLNNLRHFSSLYFHGHSAGGTNPSLLEAMGAGALIGAHNNQFNRSVLGPNAFYFDTPQQITRLIDHPPDAALRQQHTESGIRRISEKYQWPAVIEAYHQMFHHILYE